MSARVVCGAMLVASIGPACGDGDRRAASVVEDAGVISEEDAASCAARDDGEPCASDMHCFGQRCLPNLCGDGVVSGVEQCDDGNQEWGDGCGRDCTFDEPGCGDGMLMEPEECDDGNWVDEDACSNGCLLNACGNQRLDSDEECDDGNVIDDDSCSNRCLVVGCRNGRLDPGEQCDDGNSVDRDDGCTNACKRVICGNGVLEDYETCDDGNLSNGDGCPNTCVITACGNGIIEPQGGEVCEFPRIVKEPGSPGDRLGCSADCRQLVAEDACEKCQNDKCANYSGIDLVRGCFAEIDTSYGAPEGDPDFIQQCIDVVNCALTAGCGFDEQKTPAACYCGSNTLADCTTEGASADAPCLPEFQAASKTTVNADIFNRFSDLSYPVGWAYFLIECYARECAEVCVPGG